MFFFFFFQAEDGIRDVAVTGVQTCALPICVLYPFYVAAPRVWEGLAPLADQQLGGLLMWVVGTIYLWGAASVVWFRWSVREERGDADGAVPLEAYGRQGRQGQQ